MPSPVFRKAARQAQESAKRRIVIVRQPYRAELEQLIISRHWSEYYPWKGRRYRRFGGKTDAEPHGDQVHECVAANTEILNDAAMNTDQPPVEPVAESAVVFRLACNEMLTAKVAPFDLFPFTQCVMLPEHNKYSFTPKRKSLATIGIARVDDECHIKLPLADSRDNIRG